MIRHATDVQPLQPPLRPQRPQAAPPLQPLQQPRPATPTSWLHLLHLMPSVALRAVLRVESMLLLQRLSRSSQTVLNSVLITQTASRSHITPRLISALSLTVRSPRLHMPSLHVATTSTITPATSARHLHPQLVMPTSCLHLLRQMLNVALRVELRVQSILSLQLSSRSSLTVPNFVLIRRAASPFRTTLRLTSALSLTARSLLLPTQSLHAATSSMTRHATGASQPPRLLLRLLRSAS